MDAGDLVDALAQHIADAVHCDVSSVQLADAPGAAARGAAAWRGQTLDAFGLQHGSLLYAAYDEPKNKEPTPPPASAAAPGGAAAPHDVAEDAVDAYWSTQRGLIERGRDAQFCRHSEQGMCDYCMPREPYDVAYHAEHGIKHLSFHAYLRQQGIGVPKTSSSSYAPPLQEASFRVASPCPSGQHAPWPAGICTKCQPSAITLQRQPYRMVDHVEFAHASLIDTFLEAWRATATQRLGFLLGHYETYTDVPMGIKAVVEAIHEPPQAGDTDGLTLGYPWDDEARIERLAAQCGLAIVGVVYTDLEPADPTRADPAKAGLVACKRYGDSFFLSGQEALFAAQWQTQRKSACRWSQSARFNSKFVTCVLSGNPEGEVDVAAYQVSEQAMAMHDADMLEASVHPTTVRVKPSTSTRYVPDVFYRYTNKYHIDVKEPAAPTFPVEYLLVTCTHGFPTAPRPRFRSHAFPVENRPGLHDQTLARVLDSLPPSDGERAAWLSDWHLLAFLEQTGILSDDDMARACAVAVRHDEPDAYARLADAPGWKTLVAMAEEHRTPAPSADEPPAESAADGAVACPHCTFLNPAGQSDCDVCGLPL